MDKVESILLKSFVLIVSKNRLDPGYKEKIHKQLYSKNNYVYEQEGYVFIGVPREPINNENVNNLKRRRVFVLGDSCEFIQGYSSFSHASSASVVLSGAGNPQSIEIYSSIVGLPPIFQYEDDDCYIFTNAIHNYTSLPVKLDFDRTGISELFYIGHPVGNRTLFKNVNLIDAGSIVKIAGANVATSKIWHMPENDYDCNAKDYIELQVNALLDAMQSMELEHSFLSMTAGLDTRAVFAMLLLGNKKLPTCTMSSKNTSLDASVAKKLSSHYGYTHRVVNLDEGLTDDIIKHTEDASLLSGGLHSIGQTQEVFYYKKTKDLGIRRVSGNLGNQVCRKGVERITMRNENLDILNKEYQDNRVVNMEHWFSAGDSDINNISYEFLFEKEVPYSSVANYSIGNEFAAQQTPYANRTLIENLSKIPTLNTEDLRLTPGQMKLKDLKHRFFGHSKDTSFQISVINKKGGYVANYPINWGWKAAGGVSVPGLLRGSLAFVDAAVSSLNMENRYLDKLLDISKIKGMHEYTKPDLWIKKYFKDYLYDNIQSTQIISSGIFNENKVNNILHDYYVKNRRNTSEVSIILDILIAYNNYISSTK